MPSTIFAQVATEISLLAAPQLLLERSDKSPFAKGDLGGMSRCWLQQQKKWRASALHYLCTSDNLNYFAG